MNIIEKLNDIENSKIQISATIQEKGINLSNIPLSGYAGKIKLLDNTSGMTAKSSNILSGYTAYVNGQILTGQISTIEQPIPSISTLNGFINSQYTPISGYVENTDKKSISVNATSLDSNLKNYNIINGVTIFGVTGTALSGVDTFDATADYADLLLGKTAYVKGTKITGSIETYTGPYEFNSSTITQTCYLSGKYLSGNIIINPINQTNIISPEVQRGTNAGSIKIISKTATSGVVTITSKQDDNILLSNFDNNFNSGNIKSGISIFGLSGTFTNDANAIASNILSGYNAYVRGQLINGTIQTYSGPLTFQPKTNDQIIYLSSKYVPSNITISKMTSAEFLQPQITTVTIGTIHINHNINKDGFVDDSILPDYDIILSGVDNNFKAENIKDGVSIFGINGSFTHDANALASQILIDQTAYVNGEKIVGTMKYINQENPTLSVNGSNIISQYSNQIGYNPNSNICSSTSSLISLQPNGNLKPENILSGVTIFGVAGNVTSGINTFNGTAVPSTILNGYSAYVSGNLIHGTIQNISLNQPDITQDGNIIYVSYTVDKGYNPKTSTFRKSYSISTVNIPNPDVKLSGVNIEASYNPSAGYVLNTQKKITSIPLSDLDNNFRAENIKAGINMFNVNGTFTNDANAVPSTILNGYSAYVSGNLIQGTHVCESEIYKCSNVESTIDQNITWKGQKWLKQTKQFDDTEVTFTVLKYGKNITIGKCYTKDGYSIPNDSYDATASASSIVLGKTAYVSGQLLNGQAELKIQIYKCFNVNETSWFGNKWLKDQNRFQYQKSYQFPLNGKDIKVNKCYYEDGSIIPNDTFDANALSNHLLSGYTAYSNGEKISGILTQVYLQNPTITKNLDYIQAQYNTTPGVISNTEIKYTSIPATSLERNLIAKNIRYGVQIFGVNGQLLPELDAYKCSYVSQQGGYNNNCLVGGFSGDKNIVNGEYSLISGNIQTLLSTCVWNKIGTQYYIYSITSGSTQRLWTLTYKQVDDLEKITYSNSNSWQIDQNALNPWDCQWTSGCTVSRSWSSQVWNGYKWLNDLQQFDTTETSGLSNYDHNIEKERTYYLDGRLCPLNGTDTFDADATSSEIVAGKYAYVKGERISGAMAIIEAASSTIDFNQDSGNFNVTTETFQGYCYGGTKYNSYQLPTIYQNTYIPGQSNQIISGYNWLVGNQIISGDINLRSQNIISGISIFGVSGSHECVTFERNIYKCSKVNQNILSGIYVYGNNITEECLGTYALIDLTLIGDNRIWFNKNYYISRLIGDNGYWIITNQSERQSDLTNAVYKTKSPNQLNPYETINGWEAINGSIGVPQLTFIQKSQSWSGYKWIKEQKKFSSIQSNIISHSNVDNILTGKCYTNDGYPIPNDSFDANAYASGILSGYNAYANGQLIEGTMENASLISSIVEIGTTSGSIKITSQVDKKGYIETLNNIQDNILLSSIDSNFKADNIVSGVIVFGVSGIASGLNTNDANAVASGILSGQTAYVSGQLLSGTHICKQQDVIINQTALNNIVCVKISQVLNQQLQQTGIWLTPENNLNQHYCISGMSNQENIVSGLIQTGNYYVGIIGNYETLKYSQNAGESWDILSKGLSTASNYKNPYITFSMNKTDDPLQPITIVPGTTLIKVGQIMVNGPGIELVLSGITSLDDLIN